MYILIFFLQRFLKICKKNHNFNAIFDHIPGKFCICFQPWARVCRRQLKNVIKSEIFHHYFGITMTKTFQWFINVPKISVLVIRMQGIVSEICEFWENKMFLILNRYYQVLTAESQHLAYSLAKQFLSLNFTIFSRRITKPIHVCTYLNAFFMVTLNMVLIFKNSELSETFGEILEVSSAICIRLPCRKCYYVIYRCAVEDMMKEMWWVIVALCVMQAEHGCVFSIKEIVYM